jgi:protoporphyrinogen oxidase
LKISQIATKMPFTALKAGIDIISKPFSKMPDDSYENFLINRFGRTLYNLSFRDYALKVWGSNPDELDMELAKRRVAVSGIFALIKSVLFKDNKNISAEYFYYPEKGMKQIIESLEAKIKKNKGKIIRKAPVSEIKIANNKVEFIKFGNHRIKPDYVISTIPIDSLAKFVSKECRISYQKLNILYFILKKQRALKDCWIFFPEKRFIFQRVSEQKAFSLYTSPKDKTAIMVETTREVNSNLAREIVKQLEAAQILKESEIEEYFVKSIDKAYPVYRKGFMKELSPFIRFAENIDNFYLLGRQGLFNYNNMDQCWDMAMKITEQIVLRKTKKEWAETKHYFDSYRIVD